MVAHFSARSIQVSIAGRRATPASGERLIAEPLFIGIDVSKSWIDIADTRGRALRVANEETAIAAAFKNPWSSCAGMVCEATGGYEHTLMRVANKRGLPLRRAHPNRARAFGQMTARLAETGALDAQMLAEFAAFTASEPRPPLPSAPSLELADMVSRLGQLTDLHQSETCRIKRTEGARIKASITAVLKVIKAQIDAMQDAIDGLVPRRCPPFPSPVSLGSPRQSGELQLVLTTKPSFTGS
jgi:transposase